VISLVVRDGRAFVPDPETRFRIGDELLVVTTSDSREQAERRIRAVSRRGRLARWFGENGEIDRG
jgi:cell volume regulation protein A